MAAADKRTETPKRPPRSNKQLSTAEFARRAAICVALAALGIALLMLVWYAVDVLLLTFAGILLAIFFGGTARWLSQKTGLPAGWSLAVVVLGVLALLGVVVAATAATVANQIDAMIEQVPQSLQAVRERVEVYGWGRALVAQVEEMELAQLSGRGAASQATLFAYSTVGAIGSLVLVLSVGIYLAIDPELYLRGLYRLVPPRRRARAKDIVRQIADTLHWWMIGQLFAMAVIGLLTWAGLLLLGIPLALTLALIAALLNFIPNFGPILSAIPAALVALLVGPAHVAYVLLFYLGVQLLESYILTPNIQHRAVSLPPALVIMAQVLLGVLMGTLGLLLATPLAAAALVLIRELYVEDTLGDVRA